MNHSTLLTVLGFALSLKRPHGGTGDARLAAYMAQQFGADMIDGHGNLHFDRRRNGERTLFTAHTDTVHREDGTNDVLVDGAFWRAVPGSVLGADDGAGVALIASLLDAGVPGYYILFRGEECGGQGSSWLAEHMPDLLRQFDRAVAFDRAGYYDVITHQAGRRCCSDVFADALSTQLADLGLLYGPCSGGVYTDTAEFVQDIPECTNLSVGYKHQHGDKEEQDVEFLGLLADALVRVQWETLPTKRNPHERESQHYRRAYPDLDPKYYDSSEYHDPALLEGDEMELSEAITLAMDDLNPGPLVAMVQRLLWPENPAGVRMNPTVLDEHILTMALTSLEAGFTADTVAQDLFDIAYTA